MVSVIEVLSVSPLWVNKYVFCPQRASIHPISPSPQPCLICRNTLTSYIPKSTTACQNTSQWPTSLPFEQVPGGHGCVQHFWHFGGTLVMSSVVMSSCVTPQGYCNLLLSFFLEKGKKRPFHALCVGEAAFIFPLQTVIPQLILSADPKF